MPTTCYRRALAALMLLQTAAAPAVRAAEPPVTIQHYNRENLPEGRTVVTGKTAQFYDRHGMPAGKAVQTGNTVQYYDEHNMPTQRETVFH